MRKTEAILKLLFPPRCAVCTEVLATTAWEDHLCKECKEKIPFIPQDVCPHCGGKTENGGFCDFCLKSFAFSAAFAAFPYEKVRSSIHLFKYDGGKEIGRGLGQLMAEYLLQYHAELLSEVDILLAVPLFPQKEKQRGFNQTHILCEKISEKTGLIFQKDGLIRTRATVAQSTLTPEERRENLKGAFAVTEDFTGQRILLVDDIFTTGATCNECARELYRAGAKEVMIFALAGAGVE